MLLDKIWEFFLRDTLKPILVFLASAVHLVFLIVTFLALVGVKDFGRLEDYLRKWEPIKPEIFEFDAES